MIQLMVSCSMAVLVFGGIVTYTMVKEESRGVKKARHETKRLELIDELTKALRRINQNANT